MKPRVVLADDHVLVLEAFEKLLAADFDVVAKVTDGLALLKVAAKERPDIVVVDILMPHLNGLDAARQLRKNQPDVCLVFVTMMEDPELAAEAMRLGSCGYILKRSAASELVTALRQVVQKHSYVTPLITSEVVGALASRGTTGEVRRELTSRQRQVLQLIAEGHSMKEVAQILNMTPRTVAFHKYRMMQQLQITSTAQLVQFAVKNHLVS